MRPFQMATYSFENLGRRLSTSGRCRVTQPVSAVSGQGSALPWPAGHSMVLAEQQPVGR